MPYVSRDESETVNGLYAMLQPGHAEEFLADDDAEVMEFRNPTPTAEQIAEQERKAEIKQDQSRAALLDKLQTASLANIETYVRGQIDADSVTNDATAKQCLKRIETGLVTLALIVALDARNGA